MKTEDVRKGIELCDRIIAELDRLKAENEQTLRESRRRMEPIRAELRRAGYLR
jgi:F0F1-type ATP synthase membrane subunit b/b'